MVAIPTLKQTPAPSPQKMPKKGTLDTDEGTDLPVHSGNSANYKCPSAANKVPLVNTAF